MNAERLSPGRRLATRARLLPVAALRNGLVRPSDAPQGFVAGRRSI